jgi:probable HAF family extracellular repeat protein
MSWEFGSRTLRTGFALILVTPILATAKQAQAVRFLTLSDPPAEFAESSALGVSGDGQTVVGVLFTGRSVTEAFRWTETDGIQRMGTLSNRQSLSIAHDASNDGSIVIGYVVHGAGQDAFRWTAAGGYELLGRLPTAPSRPEIHANWVSDDGSLIVGYGEINQGNEAFRWTPQNGMEGLGDLTGSVFKSTAAAASADGTVIVGAGISDIGQEAFRWTASEGMQRVFNLPPDTGSSIATDVSADGLTIVGKVEREQTIHRDRAFRSTSPGEIQWLDDSLPAVVTSSAIAVSADGSIIGGNSGFGSVANEAFRWTETGGMVSLRSLIVAAGVDLTGWERLYLNDMSADGNVFVGGASNPSGINVSWIADFRPVPEPRHLAPLFGCGVIACCLAQRRRRAARCKLPSGG